MFFEGDWETCFKIELPNADIREQASAKGRSERVADEARCYAPSVARQDPCLRESKESTRQGVADLDSSSPQENVNGQYLLS